MPNRKKPDGPKGPPSFIRWVGYIAAVLSLASVLAGGAKYLYNRSQIRQQVSTLVEAANVQNSNQDFASAWGTLERAASLDSASQTVRRAREKTAFNWLDNIRISEGKKFSDITGKLQPVIVEGIEAAEDAAERADLRAHLGWIYFLRTRDGESNLDPAASYAKAIQDDPLNPYANAMWGHWLLLNKGPSDEEREHFAKALKSGRDRDFVRRLQLSGLMNHQDIASDAEAIRTANAIRLEHASIPNSFASRLFQIYRGRLLTHESTSEFLSALNPTDHVETFRWLFPDKDFVESGRVEHDVCLAFLLVTAGNKQEARMLLSPLHANRDRYSKTLNDTVDQLLKKL
jgi:hypothetical protein